jgi:hypothetical protein
MAVEYSEPMMLAIEYSQALARVSKTNASSLVRRGTVAQSGSVIDHAHFKHGAPYPTLDANRASLFARRHRVLQGVLEQRL